MPFLTPDDWDYIFYNQVKKPKKIIPVDDATVWKYFPNLRWTMNKMFLCEIQKIKYSPHGVIPSFWPVFSKPIMNIWGMGIGAKKISSKKELNQFYSPGHFWMEFLDGDHISLDIILLKGKPLWWVHSIGYNSYKGTFDYWKINKNNLNPLSTFFDIDFLRYFSSYTGILNLEIINNKIIECHPRLCSQFVPIYGKKWLESLTLLYDKAIYNNIETTFGYSIPVFIPYDKYRNIKKNIFKLKNLSFDKNILNLQICIDKDGDINGLANPPGGIRIALITSKNLMLGKKLRNKIKNIILKSRN